MINKGLLDWQQVLAYREFFDLPRSFIIEPAQGLFLLFDCPFDETIDEYANAFNVYPLHIEAVDALPQDWRVVTPRTQNSIGTVGVTEIEFDETRRKQVRMQDLGALVAKTEHLAVT